MSRAIEVLSEKMTGLSEEQLARVEYFIEDLRLRDDRSLVRASTSLSERSFEKIWNNPEDDVYDAL